jgi:protein phosphatase
MFDIHYKIKYHAISVAGNVRKNNQDNLYCNGKLRSLEDNTEVYSCYGELDSRDNPFLAVFDGMGGEEKGEMASFIAATAASQMEFDSKDVHGQMLKFTKEINHRVRSYADENEIEVMGTTFAGIVFSETDVFVGNVGDSRVYLVKDNGTEQLSVDHKLPEELAFRNIITQYIGMGDDTKAFDPAVIFKGYSSGDRYIICSDGLYEKLKPQEIGALCMVAETVTDAADILVSQSLAQGSSDNITVIVCEVQMETD